ncbi:MAG TPA: tetratricopeptide repeat-containing protein [Polyangiaceae bacterium]
MGGKEQDRLVSAETEQQAQQVWKAVQALAELRREVGGLVRDTFSTPADLADKAGSAVAKWLLKQQAIQQQDAVAERALQELMQRVAKHLQEQSPELALTYLVDAASKADPVNLPAIADKRLEIAMITYSPNEVELQAAASEVLDKGGQRRVDALRTLGKCKSQLARGLWKKDPEKAWALAQAAREHLERAIAEEPIDPDTYGTLGGLFKRMAAWAGDDATRAREYEDAMLDAYKRGADRSLHAYPLLNYLEQRASIAESRNPAPGGRSLIGEGEGSLRVNLAKALKSRELQLGNSQDRPWAAFDVARGRHFLSPNVPGFLEDLEHAVEEARSVARVPEDRYMVLTTVDSLESLLKANVQLEGLGEGIQLLRAAVKDDDWYIGRPKKAPPYLQQELLGLRAAVAEAAHHAQNAAGAGAQLTRFIQATEVRWTREDEESFQTALLDWKKRLEPRELKVLRGLWKIFGSKTLDAVAGPVPIDWAAAAEVAKAAFQRA